MAFLLVETANFVSFSATAFIHPCRVFPFTAFSGLFSRIFVGWLSLFKQEQGGLFVVFTQHQLLL